MVGYWWYEKLLKYLQEANFSKKFKKAKYQPCRVYLASEYVAGQSHHPHSFYFFQISVQL